MLHKRFYSIILLLIATITLMAQTKCYQGRSTYSGDILYSWDGKYMYRGNSSYSGDILYTFDGKYIYKGRSSYSGNILMTIDGAVPLPVLLLMLNA